MLQTYEAMLEKGQIRWIDAAPTEQSARLWITIQPQKVELEKSLDYSNKSVSLDLIKHLTSNPIKTIDNTGFLSREQANAR